MKPDEVRLHDFATVYKAQNYTELHFKLYEQNHQEYVLIQSVTVGGKR